MSLDRLDHSLDQEIARLKAEGRAKKPERIITGYVSGRDGHGPRYLLDGENKEFLRLNSNSYLSLSHHPALIEAAEVAGREFGTGPGAVRFIDGTYRHHRALEERIARFTKKPAARIFNSAYTSNCGLALTIGTDKTHWIGDALNHNSIIRAMRIANVPSFNKGIYAHNDMDDLERCLDRVGDGIERVAVIFDGIFSMRGDNAPVDRIQEIARKYSPRFRDGVITVVDDSHGIGAYGATGRGTSEFYMTEPDIVVGTFGKAFGVNGGFIAASKTVIEAVRQKADTYIYTNPLSVADCAAAVKAIDICDSPEGLDLLDNLQERTRQLRNGLAALGRESIAGPHPIVPLLIRETGATHRLVSRLFDAGVLAVGLTFPVVPRGEETIRFQVNAAHREADIDLVLGLLAG
ncbi:MAG: aminotransferase class I/II-fold pyridoxal phosphate-dependent enzyme [Desulfocapsaceae bacterium]|nr:aminotransferase class I/II-fold pyridoxal phosphate-dependent enzyme [Desulfocapsaceae bacterium]